MPKPKLWQNRPDVIPQARRGECEKLAKRAVRVLRSMGMEVQKCASGLYGDVGDDAWFVTLSDINRFLVVVRDRNNQRTVIARASADEVQRTLATFRQERAEAVVDLKEAIWMPVKGADRS
jgi:hypothetical protein